MPPLRRPARVSYHYESMAGNGQRRASIFSIAAAAALSFAAAEVWAESSGEPDVFDPVTFRLLNRQQEMRPVLLKPPGARQAVPRQAAERRGEIAVLDTSAGVFQQEFPFDLNGLTVKLLPVEGENGYTAAVEPIALRPERGDRVELGDDDSERIPLEFDFPFFGRTFREVWLNSDGNLTFDAPDTEITARDAARVLAGGPRICPLFADLDPSISGAAVHARRAADRLVVTWSSVPPYSQAGDGDPQTFQAALFASGAVEFSYAQVNLTSAVVGLGAGDGSGEAQAADFSAPSEEVFRGSVLEIFQDAVLNLGALSQSFYRGFEDAYDFLVVFHDFDLGFETDAFAFYLPVRNTVLGIGFWPPPLEARNLVDIGALLGSPRRLQGLMYMGLLDKYPDDPHERISSRFGLGVNTTLTILAHEAGHRFLARALFIDHARSLFSAELLGRQQSHWSYFMNSEASLLEGNRIIDHGGGEFRFETVGTVEGFSSLDLYLMGLLPPGEVADTFFVRNADIEDDLFSPAHEPLAGVFFNGERVDISIEDIVEAHGRRIPDAPIAQRNFRYAFLLLHEDGRPPSAESLAKVERFRAAFDDFFDEMTGRRGNAETELRNELAFSSWPAIGLLQGGSAEIAVFRAEASAHPVTVELQSDTAAVALPQQVVIPAESDFARIAVEAAKGGTARIAGVAGTDFETARGVVSVHASTAPLRAARILPLELLFGDSRERLRTGDAGQPLPYAIFIQVTDENLLAIRGVEVRFDPSGDGSVSENSVLSDDFGLAVVEWTLATAPGPNRLTVSIPGSLQPEVVIEAFGSRAPARQRNLRRQLFGR